MDLQRRAIMLSPLIKREIFKEVKRCHYQFLIMTEMKVVKKVPIFILPFTVLCKITNLFIYRYIDSKIGKTYRLPLKMFCNKNFCN